LSWQIFTGIAGGVGLFLLGMQLMTDGLRLSAGKSLQRILKYSTRTALRGVLSGALITSLVQSSSAVTVATIGFVNAGLLKLKHAIRVAYGSNLGTTMTGWLVAIIGFQANIKAFALPAIGIGMLMTLLIKQGKYPALGKVIAGFGLFFLGIDLMKSGFSGLEGSIMLGALQQGDLSSLVVFVAVGFLMTLVMQSSSAAIAMTLTAAAGNVIALPAAACMVIGANVGTTSTAIIAAIGATPNARRVAAGHVIFNLITGAIALLILPLLLIGIEWFQQNSGMEGGAATFLALFHTTFNLLGVLLLWPFTSRLVAFLKQRFVADEEDEARPKYLDNTLVNTPILAHEALAKELRRIQAVSIRMAEDAINTEASLSPRLVADRYVLDKLTDAVGRFSSKMRSTDLPAEVAESLPTALASARYFVDVAELAEEIDQKQSKDVSGVSEKLEDMLAEMRRLSISILEAAKEADGYDESAEQEVDVLITLDQNYESVKTQLLRAGAMGEITARHMVALIELMKNIERLVSHSVKGQRLLHDFTESISSADEGPSAESPDVEDVEDVDSDEN
jgi:phosphate:Na+ symporter